MADPQKRYRKMAPTSDRALIYKIDEALMAGTAASAVSTARRESRAVSSAGKKSMPPSNRPESNSLTKTAAAPA